MSHRRRGVFRLLEAAGAYELVQGLLRPPRSRRRFAVEILHPERGCRVLDIGCGTGALLDDLPPDVVYVGYDMNPHYVEAARSRHGARGTFYCARVGDPGAPQPSGEVDLVVAKGLLHHLTDAEAGQLLESAHQALRPGGRLVTLDPARHAGQSLFARLLMACDRGGGIRTPEGYAALVRTRFPGAEARLLTDLLRVPYSHCVVEARKE